MTKAIRIVHLVAELTICVAAIVIAAVFTVYETLTLGIDIYQMIAAM